MKPLGHLSPLTLRVEGYVQGKNLPALPKLSLSLLLSATEMQISVVKVVLFSLTAVATGAQ